jgi:hypothetical protein
VRETFTGIKEYDNGNKAFQARADHPYAAVSSPVKWTTLK